MSRMARLPVRLGGGISRVSVVTRANRDQMRGQMSPWRAWYNTARWRKLRLQIFARDSFTCRMCGRLEGNTGQLVADHKVAHRGDERLFWDAFNLQCLCKPCHDGAKQREERRGGPLP